MKRTFLIFSSLFFAGYLFSQNNTTQVSYDVIYPTEFHITEPLRDIAKKHPFKENKEEERESIDRNYRTPQTFLFTAEDGPQYGDDPAVRQTVMGTRPIESSKAIIKNWAGQVATAFRPMDPTGAAGPNHYVQAINGTPYRVHNKTTGANMLTANISSLWSPATADDGDPIIMYDKYADRWFVSQFGTAGNNIYIAISTTNDPTGSYYAYTYTSPQFPDYLKFSIWENGYYMTSNQTTDKVFCFERSQMLLGNPSARSISANFTTGTVGAFFVPLPADAADGGLPPAGTPLPFFCYTENSWGGGNIDGVKIWNMTVNWATTPTASIVLHTTIATSAFDGTYDPSWNDITQPGTAQKLDGIGGVPTYRAQWRPWAGYNTVVMNWGVKLSTTQRSIRWVELRQDQTTGAWSLYQESTYAPDADSRWMGSIAMDNNGSIGLAYCKSSSTTYPTLCYTGRLASDPLGTMSFTETVAIAGTSSQTTTNRYGDYSHTSLDPDGITFWHTGEYISAGVKTRIYSFQLPAPTLPPVANFSANPTTTTCSGDVQFTDASTGSPTSWLWDFGDGQTSTSQNPLHTYTTNGTYTVTLTATNGNGNNQMIKTNYIIINMPVTPTGTPGSRCGTGTVSLSATGAGTLHWFDAVTGGTDLGTGTTFTTPSISATTTYYVEDHLIQPSQYIGPLSNFAAGQYSTIAYTLNFDCLAPCTLVSVAVDKQTAGSIVIQLTDAVGTVLQTGTFTVPAGASRVTLNWPLTVATGLKLVGPANAGLWRVNTGGTFPYTLAGLVSITSCSSTTRFGSFFDWEIKEPDCVSARVPVVATVNTALPASVSIAASTTTICSGASVTFTATPANGGTTPTYQWQVNGTNTGTNSTTFTSSTLANNDIVTCIMTSNGSCVSGSPATSNSVTMTVNSAVTPAVSVSASSTTICSGTSVTFTATPANGGTPTYQWKLNGTNVGTNSSTYTNATLANGNTVTCVMTSGLSCASPTTATSNTVTMTVNANVTPAVSVAASATTICSGTSVTFTATPTNGGTPSYQWKLNGTNVGTNSATYTNGTLANGNTVTCVMTSTAACASPATATSNTVTMTVNSNVTPSVAISASSSTICSGTSVTFTATPTNGGTPSYQWKLNGTNVGTNSPAYTNGTLANGNIVSCVMTSTASCASPATATSNTVTMTVNSNVTPAVSIAASSTTICSGQSVTFSATPVNGGTPGYQWTLNGANVGTNSPTYTNGTLSDLDVVACTMTSTAVCANPATATSNAVTITVSSAVTPSVSISASATTICSGQSVTFTATPANGGTPSYQWTLNGANVGTNSPAYTNGTLSDLDVVVCTMTSSLGCASPATATSNSVTMTVSSAVTPSVSISASSSSICTGTSVTFTATPSNGGTPGYQWTLNGTNVGTNNSAYTNGSLSNNDVVECTMTSSLSCASPSTAISNSITMTVNSSVTPVIAIAASSTTICSGQPVTFNATSVNGGTPTYQWTLNGANVGTNSSTYTNSSLNNSDVVECTMTSSAPCANPSTATSNSVTMTVNASVTPTISVTADPSASVCPGTPITFTANETNGGMPSYVWTVNGLNAGTNNTLTGTYTNGQVIICSLTSSVNCANPATVSSAPVIVNIYSVSPVTVIENSGTLSSSAITGNQWYEQTSGIITGETGQDFIPTADGLYYTIVTDANGCTSVSNVTNFIYLSTGHNIAGTSIRIYPNPAKTFTTVEFTGNSSSEIEIELTDVLGRPVVFKSLTNISGSEKVNFDFSKYEKGLYFINISVDNEHKIYKIIHE